MFIPLVSAMPWMAIGVLAASASKFSPLTTRMQQVKRNTKKIKTNIFWNLKTFANKIKYRTMLKLTSIYGEIDLIPLYTPLFYFKRYSHIYYVPKMYLEYIFFQYQICSDKKSLISLRFQPKDWTILYLWIDTFLTLRVDYHVCHRN